MAEENHNSSNYNNLKRIRRFVPLPIVEGGGGVIGFLGGGMLGISILAVFIAVITATFFLLFLNPEFVKSGDTATEPPPPSDTGTPPACSDVDQLLLSTFGIIIKEVSETVSCEVRQKIYKIYSIPTRSPRYLELLRPSSPFTLEFSGGTYGRTSGLTETGYAIKLTGFASFISNNTWFNLGSFLLIHETGHLIRHRHSWITGDYPNSSLILSDPNCYSDGYLITYSRAGSNRLSENIAESSALYVYNSKNGTYGTISSFNTQCYATYLWMKKYIYGDIIVTP